MLAQACPYLSLMLTHVAHILTDVGPMLTPRPSRCPVFRSGPLPKTPMKNPWFFNVAKVWRRRRPHPVKKRCFLNTTRRIHCVNTGWTGGGRRQGRQPYIRPAPGRIYEAYAWQPGVGNSRPVSPSWVWIRPWWLTSWARLRLPRPRLAPSWWL